MTPLVVDNFSRALIELAVQKQKVLLMQRMAEALLPVVKIPEVRQFFNHPQISIADKKAFLKKVLPSEAPQEFINFFHLIIDRRYTALLPNIFDRVIDLAFKSQGFEVVTIITARELNSEEVTKLRRNLELRWSIKIFLKQRQNPNLIGGIIIQRDDRFYDGSILGRIKSLRRKLIEQSV
jgi:F-type H+-transporting ATPase subunit delta